MSKRVTSNSLQLLATQGTNKKIQNDLRDLTVKVDGVNKTLSSITKSLKEIPSKNELRDHAILMDEQIERVQEVNTGLTMAMEEYKVSESSRFNFGRRSEVPAP